MRSFILALPLRLQMILVVSLTMATAFIVALVVSQFFDAYHLKNNTDLISSVYQVMGTIYAILLTFTLWGVWQNYTVADASVQKEVYALLDLVHIVEVSPHWRVCNIRATALAYAKGVIGQEWLSLKDITNEVINVREETHSASLKIVQSIQTIQPVDERENTVFAQVLALLTSWLDARRTRILIARGNSAKALWPLLLFGALVLFAFHGLFVAESSGIWIALLAGTSFVIGQTFYLIFSMDCPFSGSPCIDSEPFHLAVDLLSRESIADRSVTHC